MDYTSTLTYSETMIISKQAGKNQIKNFISEIFNLEVILCILLSFIVMTFMLWFSNRLSTESSSRNHDFSSILIHAFGAGLNQGFPAKMKLGSHATTLSAIFCFLSMIITTIFSGLVIVKLLKKGASTHIDTLNDLKNYPEFKIMVKPNSYVDDLIRSSPEMVEMIPRFEYFNFNLSNLESLKEMSENIQKETHVLIDDTSNFNKYLKILEYFKISRKEDFYFSNVIFKNPGAWIMPKNLDPKLREEINLGVLWILDFGHYKNFKSVINDRLFQQIGHFETDFKEDMSVCNNIPRDRRTLLLNFLRPHADPDLSSIIGELL